MKAPSIKSTFNNVFKPMFIGFKRVESTTPIRKNTSFNNLKASPVSAPQTKTAVGSFTRQTSRSFQTFTRQPILMLHGDEVNGQRTSQISIGSGLVIQPSDVWKRDGINESKSLMQIVANTELRQHQRPYRVFEASYIRVPGYIGAHIGLNTLLNVDLLDGAFIFLSGDFNLKSNEHRLKHAQIFTNDVAFIEESNVEDYGAVNIGGSFDTYYQAKQRGVKK